MTWLVGYIVTGLLLAEAAYRVRPKAHPDQKPLGPVSYLMIVLLWPTMILVLILRRSK